MAKKDKPKREQKKVKKRKVPTREDAPRGRYETR